MSDIAIRVDGLGKQYRIGGQQEEYKTIREAMTNAFVLPFRRARRLLRGQAYSAAELDETIWALKDVSFEVKRGEVVGIIGRNGAGKTTLLKILSRITEPTEGQAEIRGRVGSLLEVGTGFHPELTGRENIYLNGAILGMKKVEIERRFDEIVDFSGVEKFVDTPVKRYSSGMSVRLAFAVAAHLEPEILLVDEVLAVGDITFQKKCLGKMEEVSKQGRTILLVSHNMAQINNLCKRALLMDRGIIVSNGLTSDIVEEYIQSSLHRFGSQTSGRLITTRNGSIILQAYRVIGENSQEQLRTGRPCHIELDFHFAEPIRNPGFIVSFRTLGGVELMRLSSYPMSGISSGKCVGNMRCTLRIDELLLAGGDYVLAVGLSIPNVEYLIPITEIGKFEVLPTDYYSSGYALMNNVGFMAAKHSWKIDAINSI